MYSTAIPGTFQVSTNDILVPSPPDAGVDSQSIQWGSERLRLDSSARGSAPHFRAVQLNDFTSWLEQQREIHADEIAIQPVPDYVTRNSRKKIPGVSSEKVYRVDMPVSHHLNRNVPRPNFKSADYVEPRPLETSEDAPKLAASLGIQETIQRLKADGRVIGDLHQADLPTDRGMHNPAFKRPLLNSESEALAPGARGMQIPAFKWPLVTSSLLGSPAILNLETNVQGFLTRQRNQVLITTSRRGDGGSTVAISLARQLAGTGNRVLLIDADIANPMLAGRLGLVHQQSWIQAISDRRTAMELLVTQKASAISLLPLSPIASSVGWPRKIYDQFSVIANQLAGNFDVVLIDAGPVSQWLAESSAPRIRTATTLLVTGQHSNSVADSQRAKAALLSFGIEDMLIVQNFSRVRSAASVKVG